MGETETERRPVAQLDGQTLVDELEELAPAMGGGIEHSDDPDRFEDLNREYMIRLPTWLENAWPPCPNCGPEYPIERVDGMPAGCKNCGPSEVLQTETRECGRCEKEYERYLVFIPDDFVAMVRSVEIDEEYGNVCPDCRGEIAPSHAIGDWPEEKA